nr:MAG TPA: tRNA-splicing ligase RtcB [Bacteriophage sp.]
MFEVKGKYNIAKVYQDESIVEESCIDQIRDLVDCEAYRDCQIRVMPDTHTGCAGPIGLTVKIEDKIIPATVGVDIGCGMYLFMLKGIRKENINFEDFDNYIRTHIPCGREIRSEKVAKFNDIKNLRCFRELKDTVKFEKAIGTLGSGNHFEEIDEDSKGNLYFVVHTGSRNLGKQVADYYQNLAHGICNKHLDTYFIEKANLIETYKAEGRKSEIQKALIELNKKYREEENNVSKDLAYLKDKYLEDYLFDIDICQRYASLNRETICRIVAKYFDIDFDSAEKFETIHNYIDIEKKILRKGAIAAYEGAKVIIPINMAEGSIIGIGKGCEGMNYSAPHGAGRMFSRIKAKQTFDVEEFKEAMAGIYTSCVNESTLDESPMAYKKLENILPYIKDTVDVIEVIKPVYNFKAGE